MNPGEPFDPACPGIPVAPVRPLLPDGPVHPICPDGPVTPVAPVSPVGPRGPRIGIRAQCNRNQHSAVEQSNIVCAMQHNTTQHRTQQHNATKRNTTQNKHNATQHSVSVLQWCMVLHSQLIFEKLKVFRADGQAALQ